MRLLHVLRRARGTPSIRLVGHIAADPQIVTADGAAYLAFRLVEAPDAEFRLKLFPTTPKRHRGDRVEVTYHSNGGLVIMVESLFAVPDAAVLRRRRREYLADLLSQQGSSRH